MLSSWVQWTTCSSLWAKRNRKSFEKSGRTDGRQKEQRALDRTGGLIGRPPRPRPSKRAIDCGYQPGRLYFCRYGRYYIHWSRQGLLYVQHARRKKIVASRNIGYYEKHLSFHRFMRTFRSHIVNLAFVSGYTRKEGGCVKLKDGSLIPLASNKKEKLFTKLGIKK